MCRVKQDRKNVPYEELVGTTECSACSRGVAQTEVVLTELNCISEIFSYVFIIMFRPMVMWQDT